VYVYHINELGVTEFDVVLFCGVYYHLKHPLLALAKLRQVIKDGGSIVVEGAIVDGPQEASARFYYHELLGEDASNRWVPTLPCLRQWVECSFFEIISEHGPAYPSSRAMTLFPGREPGFGSTASNPLNAMGRQGSSETIARYCVTARAIRRKDSKYVLPDEDLAGYTT
jgi:tRNA (mo5U34)-methyltransferase